MPVKSLLPVMFKLKNVLLFAPILVINCRSSSDLSQSRLNMAKKLGADATLLIKPECAEADVVAKIHELFGGEEPNRTIDACGAQSMIRLAILVSFLLPLLLFNPRPLLRHSPTISSIPVENVSNVEGVF